MTKHLLLKFRNNYWVESKTNNRNILSYLMYGRPKGACKIAKDIFIIKQVVQ